MITESIQRGALTVDYLQEKDLQTAATGFLNDGRGLYLVIYELLLSSRQQKKTKERTQCMLILK